MRKRNLFIILIVSLVSCSPKSDKETSSQKVKPVGTVPVKKEPAKTKVEVKQVKMLDVKMKIIVDNNNYKLAKISNSDFETILKKNSALSGMISPDKKVKLKFDEVDPTASTLTITTTGKKDVKLKGYFQVEKVFWSKDSSKVAFVDSDNYAYSGDKSLVIINVKTSDVIKIAMNDFVKKIKTGGRDHLSCTFKGWHDNSNLVFKVKVNYQGESGHPGINEGRKTKLGKNYGKDDPMDLGQYLIYLK